MTRNERIEAALAKAAAHANEASAAASLSAGHARSADDWREPTEKRMHMAAAHASAARAHSYAADAWAAVASVTADVVVDPAPPAALAPIDHAHAESPLPARSCGSNP